MLVLEVAEMEEDEDVEELMGVLLEILLTVLLEALLELMIEELLEVELLLEVPELAIDELAAEESSEEESVGLWMGQYVVGLRGAPGMNVSVMTWVAPPTPARRQLSVARRPLSMQISSFTIPGGS